MRVRRSRRQERRGSLRRTRDVHRARSTRMPSCVRCAREVAERALGHGWLLGRVPRARRREFEVPAMVVDRFEELRELLKSLPSLEGMRAAGVMYDEMRKRVIDEPE